MKKVKVIVNGADGKVGGRTAVLALENPNIELVGLCDVSKGAENLSALYSGSDIFISNDLGFVIRQTEADVVIDFTKPEATMEAAEICAKTGTKMVAGTKMVIGTTGFSEEQKERLHELSKKIPIVLAPNMSIGANLFFRKLGEIAEILGDDYDVEIIEYHHSLKEDAPSGTAMEMTRRIAHALRRDFDKDVIYGRGPGRIGKRNKKEICVHTVRGGDIVGEHTVIFAGQGERMEFTHKASSKDTFARGALKAALWVSNEDVGLNGMGTVLFGHVYA